MGSLTHRAATLAAWAACLRSRGGAAYARAEELRSEARRLVAAGATGLVAGGRIVPELTHLGPGFFACPGGPTELVRQHPGRAGVPPVFLHHRQATWIELETGAEEPRGRRVTD